MILTYLLCCSLVVFSQSQRINQTTPNLSDGAHKKITKMWCKISHIFRFQQLNKAPRILFFVLSESAFILYILESALVWHQVYASVYMELTVRVVTSKCERWLAMPTKLPVCRSAGASSSRCRSRFVRIVESYAYIRQLTKLGIIE